MSKKGADNEAKHRCMISGIVLAELVLYIEESHLSDHIAPVFKLADLVNRYKSRMEHYGVALENRVNSTRLKERLLSKIPGLTAQSRGRDILLVFTEDMGDALDKACEQDSDSDASHLDRAAQIVRREMFEDAQPFSCRFAEGCQERSVPSTLLALVSMVIEGPGIHNNGPSTQAVLSVSQLLRFNSVKHRRK